MHYPTVENRTYCLLEKQCDETSIIHGEQADVTKGNWTKRVERNICIESEEHQQYKAPGTIFVGARGKIVLHAGSIFS